MISKKEWVNCFNEAIAKKMPEDDLATLALAMYITLKYSSVKDENNCPVDKPKVYDVLFETREDADKVLKLMRKVAGTDGAVSVSTYYELSSLESTAPNLDEWGWDAPSLDWQAWVRIATDGYAIALPEIQRITVQRPGTPNAKTTQS